MWVTKAAKRGHRPAKLVRRPLYTYLQQEIGTRTAPMYLVRNAPRDLPRLASTTGFARLKREPTKKNGV